MNQNSDLHHTKITIVNISLSIATLLLMFFLIEIGMRVYKGEYRFTNFLGNRRNLLTTAYHSQFDQRLGWVPKRGHFPNNVWNATVTILEDNIRANGTKKVQLPDNSKVILAIGDSFTFGDEVSDHETWPAYLEKISGIRVINGGVFGYGLDQAFLRLKKLAAHYHPEVIVFSFIVEDVKRCQLSEFGSVTKPYFELSEEQQLILRENHIVPPRKTEIDWVRKIAGYSYFFHKLMDKSFPVYWYSGSFRHKWINANGAEIACAIFKDIALYSTAHYIPIFILVQYTKHQIPLKKDFELLDRVIGCIDQKVLKLIDSRTSLDSLLQNNPKHYERMFYPGHMTPEGNEFIAKLLNEKLNSLKSHPNN